MQIETFSDLIDWTRQLHEHLAKCLAHCADKHQEERARLLLEYLAEHEARIEKMVSAFEEQADPKALHTYMYDYVNHTPIETHRTCDNHYTELDFDGICAEVMDYHEQVIRLYWALVGKAEIPEAQSLLKSLLEMEENEAMLLARQTGSMGEL